MYLLFPVPIVLTKNSNKTNLHIQYNTHSPYVATGIVVPAPEPAKSMPLTPRMNTSNVVLRAAVY